MPININSAPIYSMPSDPDAFIIEWIDKLMTNAPAYLEFSIESFNKPYDPVYMKLSIEIRKTLKSMHYIETEGNRTKVRLSDKGREVKEAGGHFKYKETQKQRSLDHTQFFTDMSNLLSQLTVIGNSQTIIAEYFFNEQEKTKDSFLKFLYDKGVDLSVAMSSPFLVKFLEKYLP